MKQPDRLSVVALQVLTDVDCGDECGDLISVLKACHNVEALETVESEQIDHVLKEHRKYRLKCPFPDCQWRQKSIISHHQSKEVHLHGHFYHGVPIGFGGDDEKNDGSERIEYQAISNHPNQSELHFGHRFTVMHSLDADHGDLQSEIMRNAQRSLSESEWVDLLRNCVILMQLTKIKDMELTLRQLMALKLFCDFPDFQYGVYS